MNTDIPKEILNYFSGCAHKCAEAGLLSCSSGNLSLRLPELSGDSGLALLSATGSWLEELREDQVALCRISDGRCLNGVVRRQGNTRSAVSPARLGRTRRSGSRGPFRPRHRPDVQPRTSRLRKGFPRDIPPRRLLRDGLPRHRPLPRQLHHHLTSAIHRHSGDFRWIPKNLPYTASEAEAQNLVLVQFRIDRVNYPIVLVHRERRNRHIQTQQPQRFSVPGVHLYQGRMIHLGIIQALT